MDRIRAIMQRVNPRQRRSPESSSDSEDYEEDYHSEDSDGNDSKNNANDDNEPDAYYPGLFDVFKTRYLLQWKVVADGLPAEIVDLILDEAEYWASTETKMQRQTVIVSDHDRELLRTGPLCYEKVCFACFSTVYTWLTVGVSRLRTKNHSPIEPSIRVERLSFPWQPMIRAGEGIVEMAVYTLVPIPGSMQTLCHMPKEGEKN